MSSPTLRITGIAAIGLLSLSLGACSFAARDAEGYRSATRTLLESQSAALTTCYEGVKAADPGARGVVVVDFNVDADTGTLSGPEIIPGTTTAPAPLQQCVISSLDGLVLEPADRRRGDATFSWEFATE